MAAVVTFWQTPEDELELFAYLRRTGEVFGIKALLTENVNELKPLTLAQCIERKLSQFNMGLERFTHSAKPEPFTRGGKTMFNISEMRWNLVGYSRGAIREGVLSQSNLVMYSLYVNADVTGFVRKSDDFLRWGKNVLNFSRRMTPEKHSLNNYFYRATARAKAAVDSGQVKVSF